MLENRYLRAGAFFLVAFSVPVVLGVLSSDVDGVLRVGVVMGIVRAVTSQLFEPAGPLAE
jgi:hypothetical protein